MGHYDNCREGYCGKCGAAPGNIKNGRCEFCDRQPRRPPFVFTERELDVAFKQDVGYDPSMTLGEWAMFIQLLIYAHGEEATLTTDAGHNNVALELIYGNDQF